MLAPPNRNIPARCGLRQARKQMLFSFQ